MIKAWFRFRRIKIHIEKELKDWDLDDKYWGQPGKVYDRLKTEIEYRIRDEIMKHVIHQINQEMLDELAKKALADFDLSEMYGIALKEKVKEIMFARR